MIALTNIRRATVHGEDVVLADFTAPDGRPGSVGVPARVYDAGGEAVLQVEAEGVIRAARLHGYRAPQADRFRELE